MPAAEILDQTIAEFEATFAKEKAAKEKAATDKAAKDKAAAAANRGKGPALPGREGGWGSCHPVVPPRARVKTEGDVDRQAEVKTPVSDDDDNGAAAAPIVQHAPTGSPAAKKTGAAKKHLPPTSKVLDSAQAPKAKPPSPI